MANHHNQENQPNQDDFPKLELEPGKGWGGRIGDWLKRNSSLILATVIIIVLAGGIYVYTKKDQAKPFLLEDEIVEDMVEDQESQKLILKDIDQEDVEKDVEIIIEPEPIPEDLTVIQDENNEIIGTGGPEIDLLKEGDNYIAIAKSGEGITHLARKVLKDYLNQNPVENLKQEHKIFIEDYLQNKTGAEALKIGDKKSFSSALIQEAVKKAQNLSDAQIAKISPFVPLVPNL